MSEAFWTAFMATLPATIAAISGILVSLRNHNKLETVKTQVSTVANDVKVVAKEMNGMKEAAVKNAEQIGNLTGHAAGVKEEQERTK